MKKWMTLLLLPLLSACAPVRTPTPVAPAETTSLLPGSYWHPAPGATFQLQFSGEFDPSAQADVYDLDLFDTDPSMVTDLHARGSHVLCYISVGSWEDWRPDADRFPAEVIGRDYRGWPGEKWLDIRRIDRLAPLLRSRLDLCASKGFDGVEPDNVEVTGNDTGFPITYADQLAFAVWLADEAHARGLSIGLKNAPDMAMEVVSHFDFAVVEDCYAYGWCADLSPFIAAGKPVFAIEYTDMGVDFPAACAEVRPLGLTMLLKHRGLDAYRQSCP